MSERNTNESIDINTMIMEEKYDDLYIYLNNKQRKDPIEKRILDVLEVLYDVFDGIIYEPIDEPYNNFIGSINTNHFEEAKNYTNHQGIQLLLDKIIEYNNWNISNLKAGYLENTFYDYARDIYEYLQVDDYDNVINSISKYLNYIQKDEYLYFLSKMVDVYKEYPEFKEDIIILLEEVSTNGKVIDVDYLKRIFGKMINNGNFVAAEKLLDLFKYLKEDDRIGLNVQFMEYIYDYQKYIKMGITYPGLEDDKKTINYVQDLCNKVVDSKNIGCITINDKRKASIVKGCLKSIYSIDFTYISNDDKSLTFFIKKDRNNNFRRDEIIFKIKSEIKKQDYEHALDLLKEALSLSSGFDPYIISLMAYVYELTGNEDNLDYMKKILVCLCDVDDYHAYVESYEIALIDLDQNYMYGIPNMEIIMSELINNNKQLEEVKEEYHIDEDDLPYVVLLTAREAYKYGYYKLGYKFINLAKNYPSEDEEYKRLTREINRAEYYYSNTDDNFSQYVRKLVDKQ